MRTRMIALLPDVLAVAGASCVIYGVRLLTPWLAWVVAGLLMVALAVLLAAKEQRSRS